MHVSDDGMGGAASEVARSALAVRREGGERLMRAFIRAATLVVMAIWSRVRR